MKTNITAQVLKCFIIATLPALIEIELCYPCIKSKGLTDHWSNSIQCPSSWKDCADALYSWVELAAAESKQWLVFT